jgi:hypothetical protein
VLPRTVYTVRLPALIAMCKSLTANGCAAQCCFELPRIQTLDSVVNAAAVRAKKVAHTHSSTSSSSSAADANSSESTPFTHERAALQAQLSAARKSKHELQQTVTRLEHEVRT